MTANVEQAHQADAKKRRGLWATLEREKNMATLPQEIVELLGKSPGMTDREITSALRSNSAPQQPINIAARGLAEKGVVIRKKRHDGLIGNYLSGQPVPVSNPPSSTKRQYGENQLSEDEAKEILRTWLEKDGWTTVIAWGRTRGIDIEAQRNSERWVIEVKGIGSRSEMRVNYFIGMLGETLQRMDDPAAKYSIAVPDVAQFRGLWSRLPSVAKSRTTITALFVAADGSVEEVHE